MTDSLKNQVEQILTKYPQARNSDQWLTLKLWAVFYPNKVRIHELTNQKYVFLNDIMDLPREDNVKRIRAVIQNEENRLLPTSLDVVKQRRINEKIWKEYLNKENQLV